MSSTVWYFARSAGILAYLLLSASVLLGVLLAGRTSFTSWPRFAVEEVHRFLAILMAVFITLHVGALVLDTVVPISLGNALVPFTAGYRPFAVGLGSTTLLLVAAVGISNALRPRLPRRIWRTIHYLTLPAWLLASLHGILAGTDAGDPWFAGVAGGTIAAVCLSAFLRFSPKRVPA